MKYGGKLYGRMGRRYIPLVATSQDVDRLTEEVAMYKGMLQRVQQWGMIEGPFINPDTERLFVALDNMLAEQGNAHFAGSDNPPEMG